MISICINNYNYERFLREAIDSALAEAAASANPVEVVVVDDGSTDGSRELIATYGDRIRAVLTPNGGQAAAFNAGFAVSLGDIVLFLDADDVLLPGVCAALVDAFDADPRPVKVQVRVAVIDADGNRTGQLIPARPSGYGPTDLSEHVRRFRSYAWPPSSANAYDAGALRTLLPMPEPEYRSYCDSYLAELLPYLGPIASLDVIGVGYRVHSSNEYLGSSVDAGALRAKMTRIVANHGRAVELSARLGVAGPPPDPLAPLDVALVGFRMASLRLDPAGHPFPGDRPRELARRGIRSVWRNPFNGPRDRAVRTVWFALTGYLPRGLARAVVGRFVPDTARSLRPAWLRRRVTPS
jgi:glycosyltransferase involved in cell wall biosynthesis